MTGGPIATSASIVGTTAYVGSWDGDEYAINTTNGAVLWKTSARDHHRPGVQPGDPRGHLGGHRAGRRGLRGRRRPQLVRPQRHHRRHPVERLHGGQHPGRGPLQLVQPTHRERLRVRGHRLQLRQPSGPGSAAEGQPGLPVHRGHLQLRPQRPGRGRGVDLAHLRPGHQPDLRLDGDPGRLQPDPVPSHRGSRRRHPGLRRLLAAPLRGLHRRLGLEHHPDPDHRRPGRPAALGVQQERDPLHLQPQQPGRRARSGNGPIAIGGTCPDLRRRHPALGHLRQRRPVRRRRPHHHRQPGLHERPRPGHRHRLVDPEHRLARARARRPTSTA